MNNDYDQTENQWRGLHIQLQDMLAAYADNELGEQEKAIIEAHLAGCVACRQDLVRQQLLIQRLHAMPVALMPADMHARLDTALAEVGNRKRRGSYAWRARLLPGSWHRIASFVQFGGWGVAVMLLMVILAPRLSSTDNSDIPMLHDVLAEYHQIAATDLPVSSGQSPATVPPASWPNARLLASWKTVVGGAPAEAFAVRNINSIVFQFRINETVLFRNAKVRQAVKQNGSYRFNAGDTSVLVLPIKHAGLILVGPPDSLPSPRQMSFEGIPAI